MRAAEALPTVVTTLLRVHIHRVNCPYRLLYVQEADDALFGATFMCGLLSTPVRALQDERCFVNTNKLKLKLKHGCADSLVQRFFLSYEKPGSSRCYDRGLCSNYIPAWTGSVRKRIGVGVGCVGVRY